MINVLPSTHFKKVSNACSFWWLLWRPESYIRLATFTIAFVPVRAWRSLLCLSFHSLSLHQAYPKRSFTSVYSQHMEQFQRKKMIVSQSGFTSASGCEQAWWSGRSGFIIYCCSSLVTQLGAAAALSLDFNNTRSRTYWKESMDGKNEF